MRSITLSLKILLVLCFALFSFTAFAGGEIKGVVTDSLTGEPLYMVTVVTTNALNQQKLATTSLEGEYVVKPLEPGVYNLQVNFLGYKMVQVIGVKVVEGQITYINVQLSNNLFGNVVIIHSKEEVISKWGYLPQINSKLLNNTPYAKKPLEAIALAPGIIKNERSDELYFRGSRSSANIFYVDGEKLMGALNIPGGAIDNMTVYTGGTPAQYGDFTGGAVVITTKSCATEMARRRIMFDSEE